MTGKYVVRNENYELVAPDGGWGYMICLAAVILFTATITFMPCFGLLYNDFLNEIEVGSTEVTVLNGIQAMFVALGACSSSPLLKIMSLRRLALVGAILYNSGVIFLVFTYSIEPFFICVGVLQGAGIGFIYNVTYTILNEYFVEKRLFAFSAIQTSTAIFAMLAPQLIKNSLNEYGYRGTLLVVCAVGIQAFVGVALFQPVSKHMKKVEFSNEKVLEMQTFLINGNFDTNIPVIKLSDSRLDEKETAFTINSDLIDIEVNDAEKFGLVKLLKEVFDVSSVKFVVTSIPSWVICLTVFADITFVLILPQALYYATWQEKDVALAMSLTGFGDLAARAFFILLSDFLRKIGNSELFIIGILISIIGKVGMVFSIDVNIVYVFVVIIGIGRCFWSLLVPLVMADLCPNNFTSVMGICFLFMGLINIAIGPIIGVIRDYTDSYIITFIFLIAINPICVIAWSMR